jgi:hypothetical protein
LHEYIKPLLHKDRQLNAFFDEALRIRTFRKNRINYATKPYLRLIWRQFKNKKGGYTMTDPCQHWQNQLNWLEDEISEIESFLSGLQPGDLPDDILRREQERLHRLRQRRAFVSSELEACRRENPRKQ